MKRDLIRTTLKVRLRIIRPDWKRFFLAALPLVSNTCFFLLFVFFVLLALYPNYLFIIFSLRPCRHVSVFIWKRNFFFTDTASVHTYLMKTINEKGIFRKHSTEWNFLKTLFSRVRVDRRKRNFSRTLKTHYQFQSTPHNIKNLLKMADGRFPLLSFMLRLIFNPIACFQANLSWLFQEAAEPIIRLLSLPVSRGGRLDLPLLWLCWLWRTSQQEYKPTPKKFKDGANLVFCGFIIANTHAQSSKLSFSNRFIVYVWAGGRKRWEKGTSGREFFLKTEKSQGDWRGIN